MSAIQQLKAIEEAQGRNAKMELVKSLSPLAIQYLSLAWDYETAFGVGPQPPNQGCPTFLADDDWLQMALHTAGRLNHGEYGVNSQKARDVVTNISNLASPEQFRWWQKLLWRDPKIGVTAGSLNQVFPGAVRIFKCRKADSFSGQLDSSKEWVAEPKLDGWRTFYIKQGRTCKCMSSVGHELGFAALNSDGDIKEIRGGVGYVCASVIRILGEVDLVIDAETVGTDWQAAPASGAKNPDENLHAWAFDAFPVEFWQKTYNVSQQARRMVLEEVFIPQTFETDDLPTHDAESSEQIYPVAQELRSRRGSVTKGSRAGRERIPPGPLSFTDEKVRLVHQVVLDPRNPTKHAREVGIEFMKLGFEGAILKNQNGHYTLDRSSDWLKIKEEVEEEFRIIDVEWRIKKPALIVDVDGVKVSVGNLSDDQSEYFWSNKEMIKETQPWASIRYQKRTRDGSLRHPRLIRLREVKSEGTI